MAVYMDDAGVERRGRRWNHLTADTPQELHAFAASIGLKRCWYHSGARHPHYDVTDVQRDQAIVSGAIPVGRREIVAIARRLRDRRAGRSTA